MSNQDWSPDKLLETSGYYWRTCTLHAGVKLDLFTTLGHEKLSSKEIVQKLKTNERGVERLLNALTAMKLLRKEGDKYLNTSVSETFLSKESDQYIGHIIMHHHYLLESWFQLDQAIITGQPVRKRASFEDEKRRESFLMGMFNLASNLAPRVTPLVDLSERKHLLDLGGGPGTYAIHFCKNNPHLRATVFDLPTTRPFAEKMIEKFGLRDRIQFVEGNYLDNTPSGCYDVVWLSHILHSEGPEECQAIVQKAVSVLESGGIIAIHEFILNNTMDGPEHPALFSLNMLLGTPYGQSYSEEQIADMLRNSSVKNIQRISFESLNDSGIMLGTV